MSSSLQLLCSPPTCDFFAVLPRLRREMARAQENFIENYPRIVPDINELTKILGEIDPKTILKPP